MFYNQIEKANSMLCCLAMYITVIPLAFCANLLLTPGFETKPMEGLTVQPERISS